MYPQPPHPTAVPYVLCTSTGNRKSLFGVSISNAGFVVAVRLVCTWYMYTRYACKWKSVPRCEMDERFFINFHFSPKNVPGMFMYVSVYFQSTRTTSTINTAVTVLLLLLMFRFTGFCTLLLRMHVCSRSSVYFRAQMTGGRPAPVALSAPIGRPPFHLSPFSSRPSQQEDPPHTLLLRKSERAHTTTAVVVGLAIQQW